MSLVTVNGVGVISGTIIMPKVGVWSADLVLDQPDGTGFSAGTSATIASGSFSLAGTVAADRTGDFLDAVHVRILGGAAGMSKDSTARGFMQPGAFVRDVLNGLAADSGETLSSTIATGFLATNIASWSTLAGEPVSANLRTLLNWIAPSYSWRILPDGTLWIGAETWPAASGTFDILEQQPAEGNYTIGCESPFILPGTSLAGIGNVGRVEHQISAGRIRSRVSVELAEGDRGLQGAIARMVAAHTSDLDFYALYQCQVVTQSTDLTTVDVQFQGANKSKLAGLQRVPVRAGSGIKIQFATGATVLLGWDGGNPQAPFVCLGLSSESPTAINLAGSTPVARKGDHSGAGTLTLTLTGTTVLSGTYVDPDGTSTPVTSGTPIPLKAKLSEGSSVVGAG